MIQIATFGPAFGLPDPSPFVLKTLAQLRMAGLRYERINGFGGIRRAPKGKLPYIIDDGVTIADSDLIQAHIGEKYGFDFFPGYSAEQKALAHAVEQMVEERLYFTGARRRWMEEDGWAVMAPYIAAQLPALLRPFVPALARRKVTRMLKGQGIGRHTWPEVMAFARKDFAALATLIGDKPFLLGDRPCGTDASIHGFLAATTTPAFPGEYRDAVLQNDVLAAYMERMRPVAGF